MGLLHSTGGTQGLLTADGHITDAQASLVYQRGDSYSVLSGYLLISKGRVGGGNLLECFTVSEFTLLSFILTREP